MTASILDNNKCCYICGRGYPLHKHHIFYGTGRRQLSDDYGCWVYLCPMHHNMSNRGVHMNRELDLYLKERAQIAFEEKYGHERYMKVFGRNYI